MNNTKLIQIRKYKNNFLRLIKEPYLLIAIIFVFLLMFVFTLYPIYKLIHYSIFNDNGETGKSFFSLDIYGYIFTHKRFASAITNSLILGSVTATLSTVIGFIFAFTITRVKFPFSRAIKNLTILPLISPPFMFALSVILLFGRNGLITAGLFGIDRFDIYGFPGLILVETICRFPLAYLTLSGTLQAIDPDLETCANNLGAKPFNTFKTITLPLAMPGIFVSWLLVFVNCMTDFGNPLIIGGKLPFLSLEAYMEFTGTGNLPRGCGLAVLMLIPALSIFFLQKYILSKKSYVTITGKTGSREPAEPKHATKIVLLSFCSIILLFVLMLYATIIAGSFVTLWGIDWTPTLKWFGYVYDVGWKTNTFQETFILALAATPITVILGMVIAFLISRKRVFGKRVLEAMTMLSFAIPGTAMGIGYLMTFNKPPLLLTGTAFIIIACYIFRYLPVSVESGIASLKQISGAMEESSTNLGANTSYTFRHITLPLIAPSFFTGMIYTFIKCSTALSAIIFLVGGSWKHLTQLTLAQTDAMRLGAASVLSTILILVIMAAMLIVRKFTGIDEKNMFIRQG
jgi:iron(III) transport system permease protein